MKRFRLLVLAMSLLSLFAQANAWAQAEVQVEIMAPSTKILGNAESHDIGYVFDDGGKVTVTFAIKNPFLKTLKVWDLQVGLVTGPVIVEFKGLNKPLQIAPKSEMTFTGTIQADIEAIKKNDMKLPVPFSVQFKFENDATKSFEFFVTGTVAKATSNNWTISMRDLPFYQQEIPVTLDLYVDIENLDPENTLLLESVELGSVSQPAGVFTQFATLLNGSVPPSETESRLLTIEALTSDGAQPGSYSATIIASQKDENGTIIATKSTSFSLEFINPDSGQVAVSGPGGPIQAGETVLVNSQGSDSQTINFTITNPGDEVVNDLVVSVFGDSRFSIISQPFPPSVDPGGFDAAPFIIGVNSENLNTTIETQVSIASTSQQSPFVFFLQVGPDIGPDPTLVIEGAVFPEGGLTVIPDGGTFPIGDFDDPTLPPADDGNNNISPRLERRFTFRVTNTGATTNVGSFEAEILDAQGNDYPELSWKFNEESIGATLGNGGILHFDGKIIRGQNAPLESFTMNMRFRSGVGSVRTQHLFKVTGFLSRFLGTNCGDPGFTCAGRLVIIAQKMEDDPHDSESVVAIVDAASPYANGAPFPIPDIPMVIANTGGPSNPDLFNKLTFNKDQAGPAMGWILEFFNEVDNSGGGNQNLTVNKVRLNEEPGVGFCLHPIVGQNQECREQSVSDFPLPAFMSGEDGPLINIVFGGEPDFPDIPDDEFPGSTPYVDTFQILESDPSYGFDFRMAANVFRTIVDLDDIVLTYIAGPNANNQIITYDPAFPNSIQTLSILQELPKNADTVFMFEISNSSTINFDIADVSTSGSPLGFFSLSFPETVFDGESEIIELFLRPANNSSMEENFDNEVQIIQGNIDPSDPNKMFRFNMEATATVFQNAPQGITVMSPQNNPAPPSSILNLGTTGGGDFVIQNQRPTPIDVINLIASPSTLFEITAGIQNPIPAGGSATFSLNVAASGPGFYTGDVRFDVSNETYRIYLTAEDGNGPSNPGAPAAPTGLTATATSPTSINLTWQDNSSDETQFRIERALGAGSFSLLQNVGANTTAYPDENLSSNTQYRYRVRAENANGNSGFSNVATATTPGAAPNAPSDLVSTGTTSTTISIEWVDNSSNEDNFVAEAFRELIDGGSETHLETLAANTTSYTFPGLDPAGLLYRIRVKATNGAGDSPWSNEIYVSPSGPTAPTAPTGLTATATNPTSINLTWQDNSSDETQFRIERAVGAGSFSLLQNVGANTTAYPDENLSSNTQYRYRVRAENANGNSGFSNVATATTPGAAPNAPSDLVSTGTTSTTISIEWVDNSSNEDNFVAEALRELIDGGSETHLETLAANTTSYTFPGLDPAGLPYRIRVKATNGAGDSPWSNEIYVSPGSALARVAPTSVTVAAYPNPFNPETVIPFGLPEAAHVVIEVYNLIGQRVALLLNKPMAAGRHEVTWRATAQPSGIYLVRLQTDKIQKIQRITLMK